VFGLPVQCRTAEAFSSLVTDQSEKYGSIFANGIAGGLSFIFFYLSFLFINLFFY